MLCNLNEYIVPKRNVIINNYVYATTDLMYM